MSQVSALAPGGAEGYVDAVSVSVRVVLGEDDILLREGIARLLGEAGFEVVAQAGDADDLLRKALAHRPDVAVVDIQMPPNSGDDGLRAALQVRDRLPETGVLLLSQYYDDTYALDLIGDSAEGVGYLLKERVGDVAAFTDAVARVAAGGAWGRHWWASASTSPGVPAQSNGTLASLCRFWNARFCNEMARPKRFELLTPRFVV